VRGNVFPCGRARHGLVRPLLAGTPRNAPDTESGRRACSVPPRSAAPTGPPLRAPAAPAATRRRVPQCSAWLRPSRRLLAAFSCSALIARRRLRAPPSARFGASSAQLRCPQGRHGSLRSKAPAAGSPRRRPLRLHTRSRRRAGPQARALRLQPKAQGVRTMNAKTEIVFESGVEIDVPLNKLTTSGPCSCRARPRRCEGLAAAGSPSGSARASTGVPTGPDAEWHPCK
jgi:hypothetical protein